MSIDKYIKLAAERGPDMTKAQTYSGSGGYTPPPAGSCLLRLAGYVEIGKHKESYQGIEKIVDKALLIFEVHGKNYPVKEINGEKVPIRMTVKETISMNTKANFYKLFMQMKGSDNSITHFAQLIGRSFKGKIFHSKWTGKDGKEQVTAKLRDESGYKIELPFYEDPETGDVKQLNVPAMITKPKIFLWEHADKEMFELLRVPGEQQYLQDMVKSAVNFADSPLYASLMGLQIEDIVEEKREQTAGGFKASLEKKNNDSRLVRRKITEPQVETKPVVVEEEEEYIDNPFDNPDYEV